MPIKNKVSCTIHGVTTYFVGNYYEKQGSTITKYYFAGSQRVAMREGGTVYYLLTDHLGSTSLTTNASGNVVSEMMYSAWGGVRVQTGAASSEYTFTGQYGYDFGLMFYHARWYDPAISHFVQADTLIPGAGESQAWDRYAYANNSPVRYTDPSGHRPIEEQGGKRGCSDAKYCEGGKPKPPKPPQEDGDTCNGLECIHDPRTEDEITLPTEISPDWAKIFTGIGIILSVDIFVGIPLVAGMIAFAPEAEIAMILTEVWAWPLIVGIVAANRYGWNLIVEGVKGQ